MIKLIILFFTIVVLCGCHDAEKEAQRRELDSLKFAMSRQAIIDSMNALNAEKNAPIRSSTSRSRRRLTNPEKGAIIGAGAGVVIGSQVARDPAAGAIVGGVLGAGVGAATGSAVDRSRKKKRN